MNGNHFILWAETEGGLYKAIQEPWATRERYDEAVATGVLRVPRTDYDGEAYDEHPLVFIAFGTVEANHDFHLKPTPGPRETAAA